MNVPTSTCELQLPAQQGASCQPQFTAREIAAALRLNKRSVLLALEHVAPSSLGDNSRRAWTMDALPGKMQNRLETEAQRRGYAHAGALLAHPPQRWEAPMAWCEVAPQARMKATKLQQAMLPMLSRINDMRIKGADFEQQGVAHYSRAFGKGISTRQWRKIWSRTLARDCGQEDWERVEIYLDENPARAVPLPPAPISQADPKFKPLSEWITTFANPSYPNSREESSLWEAAFQLSIRRKLFSGSQSVAAAPRP